MDKTYVLENCNIKVGLEKGIIRVYGDKELWRFLDGKAHERFVQLIKTIKGDYLNEFNKPLAISDDSLIVEVLVHVFCDYIGLKFNRAFKFMPLNNIVKKLLKRAEVVDCGEKHKDTNRWVWDALARFKWLFIKILPNNLEKSNLKLN